MGDQKFIPLTHSCGDQLTLPTCEQLQADLTEAKDIIDELSQIMDEIQAIIADRCSDVEPGEPVPDSLIGEIVRLERSYARRFRTLKKFPF